MANDEQVLAGLAHTTRYIPQPFDPLSSQDYRETHRYTPQPFDPSTSQGYEGSHHYTQQPLDPSTSQGYHSSQQTLYDPLALNTNIWNSQMLENIPNDGNIMDND